MEIPKSDGSKRPLGMPAVRDRVVQQALLDVLQPIFDPEFYPASYGYRPGRCCHQAVAEAERFLEIACEILEGELKLVVNKNKTRIASVYESVPYLGFVIYPKAVSIHPRKLAKFRETVRKLTQRNHRMSVEQMARQLNRFLRGWINYFRVANCKSVVASLMGWIRRRLRMNQMREWKSWTDLHKALRRRDCSGEFLGTSMRRWRSSASPLVNMALPQAWSDEIGLIDLTKYEVGILHLFHASFLGSPLRTCSSYLSDCAFIPDCAVRNSSSTCFVCK